MKTTREQVLEFHKTYKCIIRTAPNHSIPEAELRYELIREELIDELIPAIKANDKVEIADALGDSEYVIEGAAITYGLGEVPYFIRNDTTEVLVTQLKDDLATLRILSRTGDIVEISSVLSSMKSGIRSIAGNYNMPLDDIIEAIHRSNMSKLDEDGNPIYRESDNKVLKGPNFFTPTESIKKILGWDEKPVQKKKGSETVKSTSKEDVDAES